MTPAAANTLRSPLRLLLLAVASLLAAGCGTEDAPELPEEGGEILWDEYGVPHIFAADHESLFRAYGWAQMRSHGPTILRLLGAARGRAAEYFGELQLPSDRWVHTVDIPDRAGRWYAEQDSTSRAHLDAFAAGMNAWAEAHPDGVGQAVGRVLPVRPRDVLALLQFQIHFTFMVDQGVVRSLERSWTPGGEAAADREPSTPGRALAAGPLPAPPAGGSNAWAVAPSRSASGNAMLLANPHLPWEGRFLWMEAHLVAPGVNAYGASLVGQPILGIAFNDRLGWTHTVNTHDGTDLYELTLAGEGYRWDGEVRPFEVEVDTVRVREDDGTLRETTVTTRRSAHGPVLIRKEGRAVALRVAGLEEHGLMRQYWDMIRARDLAAFEEALRQQQMPMFTVMYADREGHILHLFGGRTPVRRDGPWDWSGIVPGDTSATLWTEAHGHDELPRVLDPASGWLQNANDPPWTTTFPRALDPDSFPAYMAPRRMGLRPQRSALMLGADSSVTFRELVEYKHSTRMLAADRLLDDLLPAARERGGEAARRAADVLESWGREADADSRGAPLFAAFFARMQESGGRLFAEPWAADRPLSTPDGLADPDAAVAALEEAATGVEERFGRLDAAWGETRRLRRGDADLPGNGASGRYGVFRVIGYSPAEDLYSAGFGDSYVAAVEFTPEGPRARALVGYGNASRPASPHGTDQLRHVAEKELRPVWWDRLEIEAHLSEREVVREPSRSGG